LDYNYHQQSTDTLINNITTKKNIEINNETTEEVIVGPNSKLTLYRLCYINSGVITQTGIFSNLKNNDIAIIINYDVKYYILGLDQILNQFLNTHPGSSNIQEWNSIRSSIASNSNKNDYDRFQAFVSNLNTIKPGSENTVEWSNIRIICAQILSEWDSDKQSLFFKLLNIFAATKPGSSNTVEWGIIRDLANSLIKSIKNF